MTEDALVGLWFEVGGGLGHMSGQIIGKVDTYYLVRREGAGHMELLQLDDLRSAKFYRSADARVSAGRQQVEPAAVARHGSRDDTSATGDLETNATVVPPPDESDPAAIADVAPQNRRRLSDQIRKAVNLRDKPPE